MLGNYTYHKIIKPVKGNCFMLTVCIVEVIALEEFQINRKHSRIFLDLYIYYFQNSNEILKFWASSGKKILISLGFKWILIKKHEFVYTAHLDSNRVTVHRNKFFMKINWNPSSDFTFYCSIRVGVEVSELFVVPERKYPIILLWNIDGNIGTGH